MNTSRRPPLLRVSAWRSNPAIILSLLFLIWTLADLVEGMYWSDEVIYKELLALNASCYPKDRCRDTICQFEGRCKLSCSCDSQCSNLGTCCVNSPYRGDSPPTHQCRTVNFPQIPVVSYYMVHRCPNNTDSDLIWKSLCEEEENKENDILSIAPVTSLESNTTYKNYYCLRCNEETDNILYWNLLLKGRYFGAELPDSSNLSILHFNVVYDENVGGWFAIHDETNFTIGVILEFKAPEEIKSLTVQCDVKIKTACDDSWTDEIVREKCNAYTALLYRKRGSVYKNAHCVLCNFEHIDDYECGEVSRGGEEERVDFGSSEDKYMDERSGGGGGIPSPTVSFQATMDITNIILPTIRCGKHYVKEPGTRKCKKLFCAHPEYVIVNEKCTPP